jgi:hypothetical protein
MTDQNQKPEIDISEDIVTVELTIREINGLLNALNNPLQTPAVVAVGYINRIAQQCDQQVPQLIETKKAIMAAAANATANLTCAPQGTAQ